jgi:hypothetical protein
MLQKQWIHDGFFSLFFFPPAATENFAGVLKKALFPVRSPALQEPGWCVQPCKHLWIRHARAFQHVCHRLPLSSLCGVVPFALLFIYLSLFFALAARAALPPRHSHFPSIFSSSSSCPRCFPCRCRFLLLLLLLFFILLSQIGRKWKTKTMIRPPRHGFARA